MQTPKEPTRLNILAASKEEFLEHGFEKASMRRISQIAGVSTSNIYNYFENKEGILTVLVQPILDVVLGLGQTYDHIQHKRPKSKHGLPYQVCGLRPQLL